ncbi:MAG: hypothetical protein H6983_00445 [Ectothiorhodospiraceae bacterium]|nr:hypothetical protein [Ectothiorhodospiraceae bacterium]
MTARQGRAIALLLWVLGIALLGGWSLAEGRYLRLLALGERVEGVVVDVRAAGARSPSSGRYGVRTSGPDAIELYAVHYRFDGPRGPVLGETELDYHELGRLTSRAVTLQNPQVVVGEPVPVWHLGGDSATSMIARPFRWHLFPLLLGGLLLPLVGLGVLHAAGRRTRRAA